MCQRLKDEVRGKPICWCSTIALLICHVCTLDLHAELTRHNRKKQGGGIVGLSPQQVTSNSSGGGGDNTGTISEGTQQNTTQPTNQHAPHDPTAPPIPMETSPLIKANPSPQGTPMHTTFAGTQRFTPSTRISALNMVGDLLRKVGVRAALLCCPIVNCWVCVCVCVCVRRHWSPDWPRAEHTLLPRIHVVLALLALLMHQGITLNCVNFVHKWS